MRRLPALDLWMGEEDIDGDFTACSVDVLNRFFAAYRNAHSQGGANTRQRDHPAVRPGGPAQGGPRVLGGRLVPLMMRSAQALAGYLRVRRPDSNATAAAPRPVRMRRALRRLRRGLGSIPVLTLPGKRSNNSRIRHSARRAGSREARPVALTATGQSTLAGFPLRLRDRAVPRVGVFHVRLRQGPLLVGAVAAVPDLGLGSRAAEAGVVQALA
jgi:hypothetical protein